MFLDTARGPAIAAVDGDFFVVGVLFAVSILRRLNIQQKERNAYLGVDVLLCRVSEGALGDHIEKLCRHGCGLSLSRRGEFGDSRRRKKGKRKEAAAR